MTLDRVLDKLERQARNLDSTLYRLRTGQSGGRNSHSTEATLTVGYAAGKALLAEACALATDADDQPGTRFDRVAAKWNRTERRYNGLAV
jgi:hypothetical protein